MQENFKDLNASLNLYGADGLIQFDKDKEAVRQYFLQHVNPNTVFFHDLKERLDYLVEEGYYEKEFLDAYDFAFIKSAFKKAYAYRYRFESFVGAYKYYTSYTLKTFDGSRYLERYEDRVVATALYLANGDKALANRLIDRMMSGEYQPATPTFLNAGKKQRGEGVSCFLLMIDDNMESIARAIGSALQLSKRGGGVALNLTNLRERGAPIKQIENQASGVVPVMKMLEDAFSYANQLGARQGAGAVYLNAHHPDIMEFLDTKRENADEKVRIKTLSIGVVVPDVTFELAKKNEDMYLFSPYSIQSEYGKDFAEISITEMYSELVNNPKVRKKKISARQLLQTIAELQFESGYPYVVFEDAANRSNPIMGRISFSNLCVAPETMVLTSEGQLPIRELAGKNVSVWNGERFSNVDVVQTGVDQKLLRVTLSNGATVDVTEYHKWYVQRGYLRGTGKNKYSVEELRTSQLKPGDKLIKFELPVTSHSTKSLAHAYTAGFFTADGTYTGDNKPKIYLYGEKKYLAPHLDTISGSGVPDSSGRLTYMVPTDILPKFEVPHEYSLQSKIEWLTGLIDGDGTGNGVVGIQIGSIHKDFLNEVRLMLQTMGVDSKVTFGNESGLRRFEPDQKEYLAKDGFRLIINGNETQKLRTLGLAPHRVVIEAHAHNRKASHFVQVVSVEDQGRIDDTYCFTEPDRHMGVFNGVLTGNCSEILQVTEKSQFNPDSSYAKVGKDISCNLGSMNIAKAMDNVSNLGQIVEDSVRALTAVAEATNIDAVPTVARANREGRAIGLGQMNLHGYLAREHVHYDSPEAVEFTSVYFAAIAYHALKASNKIARERENTFAGFKDSKYADGSFFDKYLENSYTPITEKVAEMFHGAILPSREDWEKLKKSVMKDGLYHQNLQAVPPTGSISYINNSTSSVHPIAAQIEIRKEGKMGRVYYPAPYLTNDNREYYRDAYDIGPEAIINVYAAATEHVDQGLSCTLFYRANATTRDVTKAQLYAWKKGLKTLYYSRMQQEMLAGTEVDNCVSCML